MTTALEGRRERARQNRQELVNAHLTRRDLARMGLLTASGLLIPKSGLSARTVNSAGDMLGSPASPPVTPFTEPFRRLDVAQPCAESALGPVPSESPNSAGGEGRKKNHQRWNELTHSGLYYEVHERQGLQSFHPDLPPQSIWGFGELQENGQVRAPKFPGPVYHARYGEPICVRMRNDLPALGAHVGFGRPETSTHLHNGHTASESDGNPLDFFQPGEWYDQHYSNCLAGHDTFPEEPTTGLRGDVRETMSTLWYHDHRFDFTAQNTYKGLEGMYLLFGPHDSGNEEDPNPDAFRLPSGDFDVPMVFTDKVFDSSGNMLFDFFNTDGILGDHFTVNGTIQPFMQVHPRKYRFRCLNGGPSRFYRFFLTNADPEKYGDVNRFQQVSNDGNLLPGPVEVSSITLAVAERMDIIVDFSRFAGQSIYLENRMEQIEGRKPTGETLRAGSGNFVMRFDVVLPRVADPSRVPDKFFDVPVLNMSEVKQERRFVFERDHGAWTVNGQLFDPRRVIANPRRSEWEVWEFVNDSGGWEHPIHMHLEEFQVLSRNGRTPPITERGRKDVVRLRTSERIRVAIRFREWLGRYPLHCHNTLHEDHSMMALIEVHD
jgi:FtsP/CotA-like multicopper oxidase with cupredoxin domain